MLSSCDICTFDKAFSCTTILCFNTPLFIFSSFTHQWISLNLNIIFSFAISLGQYGNKTIALTFLCNKLHFNRQRYFAQNIICLSEAIMGNFSFILSIENWFRLVRNTFFHTNIFFAKRIILWNCYWNLIPCVRHLLQKHSIWLLPWVVMILFTLFYLLSKLKSVC